MAAPDGDSVKERKRLITLVLASVIGLALVVGAVIGTGMLNSPEPTSTAQPGPVPTTQRANPPTSPPESPPEPPALPVRDAGQQPGTIRLPQGGTATLVREEIDASGTLPIPDGVSEATWWGAGLDASNGATVLAGHVNWKGAVGPFAELWESAPGQEVSVRGHDRNHFRYRVSEIITVDKEELPQRAAELFGQGGPHRLVLVTCGGRFVGGDTGYDENRIVVATPA